MLRKSTLVAMGMLLACASVLISVPSAVAASYNGDLRIKGPSSTAYTNGPVSLVGTEGTTLTWTFAVLNTGGTMAQFRLRTYDGAAPLRLYDGTLLVEPLADSPDGYYTRGIPAGGSQVFTARLTIPFDISSHQYFNQVQLYATDDTYLDGLNLIAEQAAGAGTTGFDMALKAGSQKPVGNGRNSQYVTGGTIASGGTAQFTATLKNHTSPTPTTIGFALTPGLSCANFTVTVKQGTKNVTADVLSGNYVTRALAKGNSVALKILVKAVGPAPGCNTTFYFAYAGPPSNFSFASTAIVNMAA